MEPWSLGCHQAGLPSLCFVQQLLWKGLLDASTQRDTVLALTCTLQQLAACLSPRGSSVGITTVNPGAKAALGASAAPAVYGMSQLLGKCSLQIVAAFVGGLPWALLHRHDPKHQPLVRRRSVHPCMCNSVVNDWLFVYYAIDMCRRECRVLLMHLLHCPPCVLSVLQEVQHVALRHQEANKDSGVQVSEFCAAAAAACAAYGAAELAPRITALAAPAAAAAPVAPLSKDSAPVAKLLQNLARPFIHVFFPTHASLPLVFNLVVVLKGPEELHAPCLLVMKAIFSAGNLELGSFGRSEAHVSCLKTLVLLLEGGRSAEVLDGLDVILDHLQRSDAEAKSSGGEPRRRGSRSSGGGSDATAAADKKGEDAQQVLADFLPMGESAAACKAMAAALRQCVSTGARPSGRGAAGWAQRSRFLPFVQ
jgi:hypothetical protein